MQDREIKQRRYKHRMSSINSFDDVIFLLQNIEFHPKYIELEDYVADVESELEDVKESDVFKELSRQIEACKNRIKIAEKVIEALLDGEEYNWIEWETDAEEEDYSFEDQS